MPVPVPILAVLVPMSPSFVPVVAKPPPHTAQEIRSREKVGGRFIAVGTVTTGNSGIATGVHVLGVGSAAAKISKGEHGTELALVVLGVLVLVPLEQGSADLLSVLLLQLPVLNQPIQHKVWGEGRGGGGGERRKGRGEKGKGSILMASFQ